MFPVVTSTTYGERDAESTIIKSWEMLGGMIHSGICAYVEDFVEFETNKDYIMLIEKCAENMYRSISKQSKGMPNSQTVMKQKVLSTLALELTPQESEQLSVYASDNSYIKKQKEDIQELTLLFKGMLGEKGGNANSNDEHGFIEYFKNAFHPMEAFEATYCITMQDKEIALFIHVKEDQVECEYREVEDADVIARTTYQVMQKIVRSETTFQKAFMTGDIAAKGNFKTLRAFDSIFQF